MTDIEQPKKKGNGAYIAVILLLLLLLGGMIFIKVIATSVTFGAGGPFFKILIHQVFIFVTTKRIEMKVQQIVGNCNRMNEYKMMLHVEVFAKTS